MLRTVGGDGFEYLAGRRYQLASDLAGELVEKGYATDRPPLDVIVSKEGKRLEQAGDPLRVRLKVAAGTHHVTGSNRDDTITLTPGVHVLDLAGRRNLAAALRDHVRTSSDVMELLE